MIPEPPTSGISRDAAMSMFVMLTNLGYGCAIKHLRGYYYIEVPVRLNGDKAYHKEAEISALAFRAGYVTMQSGHTLRIIG